jgi:outer membrane protein
MRSWTVSILAAVMGIGLAASASAKELKIAFIDSDRILESNDDYRQAKQKMQEEERQYIAQATSMEETLKTMADELHAQSLMLSDEARRERETRFLDKQQELEKFRKETWGEGGKLFTRNQELSKPIMDKINAAIQKVSQEIGYDLVFDAASASIVYAVPELDITDRVIEELKKE